MDIDRSRLMEEKYAEARLKVDGLLEVLAELHSAGSIDMEEINRHFRAMIGDVSLMRIHALSLEIDLPVEDILEIVRPMCDSNFRILNLFDPREEQELNG